MSFTANLKDFLSFSCFAKLFSNRINKKPRHLFLSLKSASAFIYDRLKSFPFAYQTDIYVCSKNFYSKIPIAKFLKSSKKSSVFEREHEGGGLDDIKTRGGGGVILLWVVAFPSFFFSFGHMTYDRINFQLLLVTTGGQTVSSVTAEGHTTHAVLLNWSLS